MSRELPTTEEEVNALSNLFNAKGKEPSNFINSNAKEQLAKSGEMGNYNYIHIALHTFINQDEPEFSGIIMASEETSAPEDGILFSRKVYDINLNAELIHFLHVKQA